MSQSGPPVVRGFQLDASAIGDATKSVNLFRGDVNFPLKLVSLSGPNGLDLNLSALYAGSNRQQVDTWNLDAPTGVLGLGWSMPFDFIEFQHADTASYLEGHFIAHINGQPNELILVSWSKRGEKNEQVEFADPEHPLWQYIYDTQDEVWLVQRDDGVTMTFGGNSHPDAVQWGVRWDNWVGSSKSGSGDPDAQQFGVAWNLTEVRNQWGNTLTYWYDNDERTVAAATKYTRASYIRRVQDARGRSVEFLYKDKDPHEYQPPHTVDGQAPADAYQDRYETKYLSGLDVKAPSGEVYYSIAFEFQLMSLGDTSAGSSKLTNSSKRYLKQVRQHRKGRDLLPPLKFDYNLEEDSISRGKVTEVTYPAGGSVKWVYKEQSLGDSEVFKLDYTAMRPPGAAYKSAGPRIWFGADYVVMLWWSQIRANSKLQIFEYGGRWANEPCEKELNGFFPSSLDDVHIAFGSDFFAFYFHNQANTRDRLFIYQKTPHQFGRWTTTKFEKITSTDSCADETALVAGNDFIALHPGGTNTLYRFAYDRRARQWSQDQSSGSQNESRMALAAQGNVLAVGFFTDDKVVSATDQVYWLDSGAELEPQWTPLISNSILSPHGRFEWNSEYVFTYMRIGAGFAVGTYPEESQGKLQVTRWQRNFIGFSPATLDGDVIKDKGGMPLPTELSGNVVANGGFLYRYNGNGWVRKQVGWRGKTVVAEGDNVLATTLDGSGFDAWLAQYVAGDDLWQEATPLKTPTRSPAQPALPQFGGRFLTLGANLYFEDTDGNLNLVDRAFEGSPGSTVACRGPNYVAYETRDNPDQRSTKIALLLNGRVDGNPVTLEGQRIGDPTATGTVLTGPTAFATYHNKYQDFRKVPQFTLHRILNRQVGGFPTDCVVSELKVSTGTQVMRTVYTYDAQNAVFDPSGKVAQYPQVTAERQDASRNNLGKTTFEYLNGLESVDPKDPLVDCYSLANGFLKSKTEYKRKKKYTDSVTSPDGPIIIAYVPVATTKYTWEGVRLSMAKDGGFAMLANSIVLKQTQIEHTLHNLPVIALGGGESTKSWSDLTSVKEMEYDKATAYLLSQSESRYNSQGKQENRKTEYRYAWALEQYAPMRDNRLLKPVAQTILTVDGDPVQSHATTYRKDWGNVEGWGSNETFTWLGEGKPDLDFAPGANRKGWLKQSAILSRDQSGIVTESTDAMGVVASILLDQTGMRPICRFTNASLKNSEAGYTGFEPYEADQGWRKGKGDSIEALLVSAAPHTGSRCVHLPPGSPGLQNTRFKASAGCDHILFGCWVRTPAEQQGPVDARWTITVGAGQSQELPVPDTQGGWAYISVRVPVPGAGGTITCRLDNKSELWVDDILVMPSPASFMATVYDITTLLPVARLGANGETTRVFYDQKLHRLATTSCDENLKSTTATFLSRDSNESGTYDPSLPNARLSIHARGGGSWDDFEDSDYARRWQPSGSQDAWEVKDRRLVHLGSGKGLVTLKGSEAYRQYAVRLQVHAQEMPKKPLSLRIGDQLTVRWKPREAQWEMLVSDAPVASFDGPLNSDWLLIAMEGSASFFLNGRQVLQYAGTPAKPIMGPFSFETSDQNVSFAQVLVFRQPMVKLTYSDGTSRPLQHHSLDDGGIVVREVMYDALGRASIWTKPARYDETAHGFQPKFATAPDTATGVMGGYVSEYYNGRDGRSGDAGYPYSRKRFEMSDLHRVIEVGQPGKQLAIRPENPHTQKHQYGVNGPAALFNSKATGFALAGQKYAVSVTIEPNGKRSAGVHETTGKVIAAIQGPADFPTERSLVTASRLDRLGNPVISMPPNSFNPPPGSDAKEGWTTAQYDTLGRMTERGDPDMGETDPATGKIIPETGLTRYVYDPPGRLRFTMEPVGAEQNPNLVLYWKYDPLGRIMEKGTCHFDWGDGKELQNKANTRPDWPSSRDKVSTLWKKRYYYDGDSADGRKDATSFTAGRLTQALVNNSDSQQPDVIEDFTYDIRGNVISKALRVTGYDEKSHIVSYEYDLVGNITRVTYGVAGESKDGDGLHHVVYSYDCLGQMVGIGPSPEERDAFAAFRYHADGKLAEEKLNRGRISIPYSYEPPGWPARLGDGQTPFSETLEYGTGEAEGVTADPSRTCFEYHLDGDETKSAVDNYAYEYAYDIHARVQTAMSPEHPDWHVGTPKHPVTYDGNDNIVSLSRGGESENDSYYPGTNRLKSIDKEDNEFGYDPNGNVIKALTRSPDSEPKRLAITVDPFTQMTTKIDVAGDKPNNLAFSYGDNNQRVLKTVREGGGGASSRLYIRGLSDYPQIERTMESNGDERFVRYVYGPRGLVAMSSNGHWYFILRDHERSTRVVLTESGELAAGYDYFPFGKAARRFGTLPEIIPYRYTGQEYDSESGLYNYRARMYNADLGRFLGLDPQRQYPSPYVYVGDDPTRLTDPTGERSWEEVLGVVVGAVVGGLEVIGGAMLDAATFGGAEAAGGLLIGAGSGGFAAGVEGHGLNSSKWWKAEAVGAVSGLVTGGISEAGGAAVEKVGLEGTKAGLAELGVQTAAGTLGNISGKIGENIAEHESWSKGMGGAATTGAISGFVGGAFSLKFSGKSFHEDRQLGYLDRLGRHALRFAAFGFVGGALEFELYLIGAKIQDEEFDWKSALVNAGVGVAGGIGAARSKAELDIEWIRNPAADLELDHRPVRPTPDRNSQDQAVVRPNATQ